MGAGQPCGCCVDGFLASYRKLWKGQSVEGVIEELCDCDQSGESLLANLRGQRKLSGLLRHVDVDAKITAMDLPARILLFSVSCGVMAHRVQQASNIKRPKVQVKIFDDTNSQFNEVVGVRLPYEDEESSCAGTNEVGVTPLQSSLVKIVAKLPLDDSLDPKLEFCGPEAVVEGVAFGEKLLGPALPKPRFSFSDLCSDAAQANIAYYGVGQLHLVRSDDRGRGEHMVDARALGDFRVRPAFERYGAAAYFRDRQITGIFWTHGGKFVTPGDPQWEHAKFAWRVSLFTWVTAIDHLVHTHWIVANALNSSLRESLPPEHPIRRVMHVNVFGTSKVNTESIYSLGIEGSFLHRSSSLEWEGGLAKALRAGAERFRFRTFPEQVAASDLPAGTKARLPLFVDGLQVWAALHRFYTAYVAMHYADDAAVRRCQYLKAYWQFRCVPFYTQGLPELSRAALVDQLAHACFHVTAGHQVAGDIVQYVTMPDGMCFQIRPGKDMMDARQMTCVLSITASTGRTMPLLREDWWHLLAAAGDSAARRQEYKDLHARLVQDLEVVSRGIRQRCKEQPVPFTEMDPMAFECSVSI